MCIFKHLGYAMDPRRIHVAGGKNKLLARIPHIQSAARFSRWVVLVDLDQDAECAPGYRELLPSSPPPGCLVRIAVRALESWLLADAQGLSNYLRVPRKEVPAQPDLLNDPKREIIRLAQKSSAHRIIQDMVPRPGSGRPVGQLYVPRMSYFMNNLWNIDAAINSSESLLRCVNDLEPFLRTDLW